MSRRPSLSIGGLSLRFLKPVPGDLPPHYRAFFSRVQRDSVRVDLSFRESWPFRKTDFNSGGIWTFHRRNGARSYRVLDFDRRPPVLPCRSATISGNGSRVLLEQRRDVGCPLSYPLDQLMISDLLSDRRGVLLHACGIVDAGKGYIFAGQSGAGKTTTARLWMKAGAKVLSDDRIIMRLVNGSPRVFGTPWPGTLGIASPRHSKLRAIFLIKQAQKDFLKPLSRAEAVSRLVRSSIAPIWSREAMEKVLAALEQVLVQVPAFELSFTATPRSVSCVRRSLA